jgi:hypothetical protein
MKQPFVKSRVLKTYGLTLEQYRAMRKKKPGCWICGQTKRKDGRPLRLNIDHDHQTGRVRGILCFQHNKFLVGRHRTGELLAEAAAYLDSGFDGRKI